MEIVQQGLGRLFITTSSSHFFNKTNYEQHLFNVLQLSRFCHLFEKGLKGRCRRQLILISEYLSSECLFSNLFSIVNREMKSSLVGLG